jgi:hypothetical protein
MCCRGFGARLLEAHAVIALDLLAARVVSAQIFTPCRLVSHDLSRRVGQREEILAEQEEEEAKAEKEATNRGGKKNLGETAA